jgi:hypothetical protein
MITQELRDALCDKYTAAELVDILEIDLDELLYYIEELVERSLPILADDFPELIASEDDG